MHTAILRRRLLTAGALVLLSASVGAAFAQDTPPSQQTATQRLLSHIDFGLSAAGLLNSSTSGPITTNNTTLKDSPSNTVGGMAQIRYTRSPLVGAELNFVYSRSAQNFTGSSINPGTDGVSVTTPYTEDVQATVMETTVGYVVHTPRIFGFGTFVSGGAGATDFRPTRGGGQSLPTSQARATYYYSAGLEDQIGKTPFGLRAAFRQAFHNAPDFQATYFRDHQRTNTIEPTVGIFVHF